MNRIYLGIAFCLTSGFAWGQSCFLQLDGQILDKGTRLPMSYATVQIIETGQGVITDDQGRFLFDHLCPGQYHIQIGHIGFEVERAFIDLSQNTTLSLSLDHHDEMLDEIVVHGENAESITQISHVLGAEKILYEANNNLADIAANITGVSVVKNGPGISKPVIHGLYGNRVTILNNGVRQAGQRWGNDHAPEIDMFVADHLAVVKGVAGLEISGGSLGGVLQIHPGPILQDPHVHGSATYIFQSNGLAHTLSGKVQNGGSVNQWRIVGTTKYIGDSQSPDYYLTNSGRREADIAGQWNRIMSEKWKINTYYSFFSADIAILKGSHITNLSDLENSFVRDKPFGTIDHFSYHQEAPRQEVDHHLLSLESQHLIDDETEVNFRYGGQINNRKEYDVRRGGRSERPALSMLLNAQFVEMTYKKALQKSLTMKSGLQYTFMQNKNDNSTTGLSPLIPDYTSHTPGAFLTIQQEKNHTAYEIGGRIDYTGMEVINIVDRQLTRRDHDFINYAVAGGFTYNWNTDLKSKFNLGLAQRSPEVNEMYSEGLHQGVATYEVGDPNLKIEKSIKGILSNDYSLGHDIFFQTVIYAQHFSDYIYLKPEGTLLTIRGAFPLYLYDQTDALLYGLDIKLTYEFLHKMKFNLSYAYLQGKDLTNDVPLVMMPANNLSTKFHYSLNEMGVLKNNTVTVGSKYVFRQRLEADQDLVPPPDGYVLLDISAKTALAIKQSTFNVGLKVENVLNTAYRDYLDQMRYFADAPGINAVLTLNYKF